MEWPDAFAVAAIFASVAYAIGKAVDSGKRKGKRRRLQRRIIVAGRSGKNPSLKRVPQAIEMLPIQPEGKA